MIREIHMEAMELVEKAKIVFVSSVDQDGFPNTKAMFASIHEGIGVHYFSTKLSSRRAAQFRTNPKACIYFCDDRRGNGLMLVGTLEVCTDSGSRELIWKDGDEMYYPGGVTDPDYCVFRFTAQRGNYYHALNNVSFLISEFPCPEESM